MIAIFWLIGFGNYERKQRRDITPGLLTSDILRMRLLLGAP